MTAYPFSGTLQDNCIEKDDPKYEDFLTLVNDYCKVFRITPEDIRIKIGGKNRPKVYKKVHVDHIRMALAYYIQENSSLTLKEISILSGYSDHSSPSRNRTRVRNYLKNGDPVFKRYWDTLLKIA
jgi:DNA-binding XRE family transcriptional regulator